MTTRLTISSAQVTALAKGAAKANCVAEVKIGETVIRLIPIVSAQDQRPIAPKREIRL